MWVHCEPVKNFHSLDSPPILVVLLCGLNGGVDATMLKWFLMETALGLASFPGCRPQIRICSSTANREKKVELIRTT